MSFTQTLRRLETEKLIHPPSFLIGNLSYATIMGSMAYGVSSDSSDMDVYGFCIPTKELLFPTLGGEIPGFGRQLKRFEQYQEHHVKDPSAQKEYDITIYSIVKYFQLCMDNNPNMIDSLFTPRRCVLHTTLLAELMIENRHLFLHKGAMHKLRGYAYAQLSKIENKNNSSNPKRQDDIAKHNYDTKFGYHLVRLVLEAEQILNEHDLDLERNREILKSIRRGEWELERLKKYFYQKEKALEDAYSKSTLREFPDESAIKALLVKCLEHHYGSLDKIIPAQNRSTDLLRELETLVERYR
jgi:predicted nucleotidyltransferase